MHRMFLNAAAVTPFEEGVRCAFAKRGDAAGVRRRFKIRAAVVRGQDLAGGAGASVAQETGDRLSVVMRREAWPVEEAPAPGTRFEVDGEAGIFICKSVQPAPLGWECVCTRNMRGEAL